MEGNFSLGPLKGRLFVLFVLETAFTRQEALFYLYYLSKKSRKYLSEMREYIAKFKPSMMHKVMILENQDTPK